MGKRAKIDRTLGEHAIFGDEEASQLRSDLDSLRSELAELSGRVHAQFTTISAHAEIAREQSEVAREEARADLDRTRATLIELIETARAEAHDHHVAGAAPGPSSQAYVERFERLEHQLTVLKETVERCFERQNELADTMTAFLDTMLAADRGEPVTGLALS